MLLSLQYIVSSLGLLVLKNKKLFVYEQNKQAPPISKWKMLTGATLACNQSCCPVLTNEAVVPYSIIFIPEKPFTDINEFLKQAVLAAEKDYILFLNSSIEPGDQFIRPLLRTIIKWPEADAVTGKLVYKNGLTVNTLDPHPDFWYNNYFHFTDQFSLSFLLLRKTVAMKLTGMESTHLRVLYCPWAVALLNENKPNNELMPSASYNSQEKRTSLLMITANIPEYDKDSGSNMITERIRILCKHYTVYLFADAKYYYANTKYTCLLQELGCRIIYPHEMQSASQYELNGILQRRFDYLWVTGLGLMEKYFNLIKELAPASKLIYDTIDIHFIRLEREEKVLKKPNSSLQLLKQKELWYLKHADISFVVSSYEQEYLLANYQLTTHLLSNIHTPVNTGLKEMKDTADLLFIGGFKHEPNIDAVKWLHKEIMPLVWKTNPEIKVHIIGSHSTPEIKQLHADNFIIYGFIENVKPYFTNSRIFICPLRYGAGVKGKIGQALEFSLPIVSTGIGTEGMDMIHGRHCLTANDAPSFADAVLQLYNDESLWHQLRSNSKSVLEKFSPQVAEGMLKKVLA